MATFLVYTPPAAGHVFPLVPGLLALQARGHAVYLRTDPELADALRAEGLDAAPLDARIAAVAVDDYKAKGGLARLHKGPNARAPPAPRVRGA